MNAEKEVTSLELDTLFGHDGFLLEVGDLGKAISAFISPDPKLNQHSDTQAIPVFHDTEDFDLLETAIPNNSRILDLGCGNGDLIERLKIRKNVQGLGVDKNFNSILSCLRKGVPVIQKDLDEGLKDFGNHSFDFAILNRTLQEVNMPLDLYMRSYVLQVKRSLPSQILVTGLYEQHFAVLAVCPNQANFPMNGIILQIFTYLPYVTLSVCVNRKI